MKSHLVRIFCSCRWRLTRNSRHRLCGGVSLVAYVLVVTGLPIPVPQETTQRSAERYPCENKCCGCCGTEQCWKKCCCHTLAEKLAWARGAGVTPPEDVLVDAASQGLDVSHWDPGHRLRTVPVKGESVAARGPKRSCCSKRGHTAKAIVSTSQSQSDAKNVSSTKSDAARTIVLLDAMACQGIDYNWLTVTTATTPPLPLQCPSLTYSVEWIALPGESVQVTSFAPDSPPPKSNLSIA